MAYADWAASGRALAPVEDFIRRCARRAWPIANAAVPPHARRVGGALLARGCRSFAWPRGRLGAAASRAPAHAQGGAATVRQHAHDHQRDRPAGAALACCAPPAAHDARAAAARKLHRRGSAPAPPPARKNFVRPPPPTRP
jgi:hypothetical protein